MLLPPRRSLAELHVGLPSGYSPCLNPTFNGFRLPNSCPNLGTIYPHLGTNPPPYRSFSNDPAFAIGFADAALSRESPAVHGCD
jgi:hypothetical protein